MQKHPNIAVIGGGPGGLTLARILHVHGVPCTVFERDEHAHARPQGGSLDLHVDSGILALERAGLTAEFRRIARYEDQGMRMYDDQANLLFGDADTSAAPGFIEGKDRPEVDRTALRAVLLASLPPIVRWGARVRGVEPLADHTYQILTDDGAFGPYDLVVGADGAWSRVRPLVSAVQPLYTGVTFLELEHEDVDATHPEMAAFVGRGKMFALGESRTVCSQRSANAHYRTYVAFRRPEAWAGETFDVGDPAATRAELVHQLAGFAPPILEIVRRAGDRIAIRGIHALPVGHRWPHRPGVTLIGDAAHLMSPFSGEGVNIAMHDAAELAERLITRDLESAVRAFEEDMFERAAVVAAGAAQGIEVAVGPDAKRKILAWMASLAA